MHPGFNHNIKYKGQIFHVQTEDSGVKNPHIITLLYSGGNILNRIKSSYADILDTPEMEATIVELMKEQHKGMVRQLKDEYFDKLIVERGIQIRDPNMAGPAPAAPAPPPATTPAPQPPTPAPAEAPPVQPAPPTPPQPTPPPAQPAAPAPGTAQPPAAPPAAPPQPPAVPPQTPAAPPPQAPPAPPAQPATLAQQLGEQIIPEAQPVTPEMIAQEHYVEKKIDAEQPVIEIKEGEEFNVDDIFSADLISDKSLDQVILDYLANDQKGGG